MTREQTNKQREKSGAMLTNGKIHRQADRRIQKNKAALKCIYIFH